MSFFIFINIQKIEFANYNPCNAKTNACFFNHEAII